MLRGMCWGHEVGVVVGESDEGEDKEERVWGWE